MKEFSATSPMVGLAWKPVRDLRLRASWNKAFRAPVVHDLTGGRVDFKKGGVAAVRLEPGGGELIALLRPHELESLAR